MMNVFERDSEKITVELTEEQLNCAIQCIYEHADSIDFTRSRHPSRYEEWNKAMDITRDTGAAMESAKLQFMHQSGSGSHGLRFVQRCTGL
mgnify:FL=1